MKAIVLVAAVLLNIGIFAQDTEPIFEGKGRYIKGTYFHDNGLVSHTGHFLDGKLHGEWVMYNKEGKKIALGEYEEGRRTGKWFFWQEEGRALREVTYIQGRPVQVITWNNSESML
ncbi:toxin-antitoxin system YwqK family antitoxin [Poritiphilus flavus]|uniref:Nicotinic acid mononucleotide adenyltransferase n=1 Tax=Poritiphilus flavus TaxID=2697053 RepID=A0A6L9EHB8_9FLAO|nr:nicotinic acid mononucleotide adenyltransferase [Poritiphilus flavus]NAS14042.1 nicotinic acid mononucleotide adenyltransferase [Poritiphilus flavus]